MTTPAFTITHNANPMPVAARDAALANPGFGTLFTDHMAIVRYTEGTGWHDAEIVARGPLSLDPATSVLHYAQEIFEGMKAYRHADGSVALFRPEANAARFNQSADRMAMPHVPEDLFLDAVKQLVAIDRDWIPAIEGGSLYLRPFMFASEVFLGVRPAKEYLFLVIASPVGAYFKGNAPAVTIWVSEHYTRAAPGGTGAAKCGGNYAASLVAQAEATKNGCDQVVFLDAVENRFVEELGGMNLFFLFSDGRLRTPPLGGTILPGITRDSILQLAREEGLTVEEAPYAIDNWAKDAASGALTEVLACGTAAVVTPVGCVKRASGADIVIGNGGTGSMTERLKARLTGIQRGEQPDTHGWVRTL